METGVKVYPRLLNIPKFREYAGSIGKNNAYKLAEISGARIKFGNRVFVDKEKFDAWLDKR